MYWQSSKECTSLPAQRPPYETHRLRHQSLTISHWTQATFKDTKTQNDLKSLSPNPIFQTQNYFMKKLSFSAYNKIKGFMVKTGSILLSYTSIIPEAGGGTSSTALFLRGKKEVGGCFCWGRSGQESRAGEHAWRTMSHTPWCAQWKCHSKPMILFISWRKE